MRRRPLADRRPLRRHQPHLEWRGSAIAGHSAIALGTLEEDPGIRRGSHIFVVSTAPWFKISDALPRFAADAARHSE